MAPSHTKPRDASRAAHAGETSAHPEGARGRGKGRQLFLSPGHHVIQRSQGALAHKMDGDGKNLTRRSCAARRHSYLIVARARVYRSAQRGGGLEFTQSQLAGRETHKSREAEPRCSTQDHSESFARTAARRRTQKRALRTALRTAHHTEIPQKPHRTRPHTSPRARNAAERAALRNAQRCASRQLEVLFCVQRSKERSTHGTEQQRAEPARKTTKCGARRKQRSPHGTEGACTAAQCTSAKRSSACTGARKERSPQGTEHQASVRVGTWSSCILEPTSRIPGEPGPPQHAHRRAALDQSGSSRRGSATRRQTAAKATRKERTSMRVR